MIRRRAAAAGIATKIGNHTFRATGITAYLENGGTLEKAAGWATFHYPLRMKPRLCCDAAVILACSLLKDLRPHAWSCNQLYT
jgi:hypothetical protein